MKSTTHTRKPNLNILALDRRDLPSVSLGSTGILTIDCGNLNDSVSVSTVGTSVKARVITTAPGASIGTVFEKLFWGPGVTKLSFNGRAGNDKFINLTGLPSQAGPGTTPSPPGPARTPCSAAPGTTGSTAAVETTCCTAARTTT
jgi:hypothetical protein